MKMIFRYLSRYWSSVIAVMVLKLVATFTELMLPYILEHLLDQVVPAQDTVAICLWGGLMVVAAIVTWIINKNSNHKAVDNAHRVSYDVRRDLFNKTIIDKLFYFHYSFLI